jgi:NitT/TauT family transport system substrate-binding protein
MLMVQNRRNFLTGLAAAGVTGLAAMPRPAAAAEPPPETTTIRLPAAPAACLAPLFLAEELLHEEGFTEVRYVPSTLTGAADLPDGNYDIDMQAWSDYLPLVNAGRSLTVLAGVQVGCLELRANDSIGSIADLRGKRVGINNLGVTDHMLVSLMAAFVGLDPAKDITWVVNPSVAQAELFAAGEIDAFIGFPPEINQPCPRNLGHVVVNTAHDRPWSDYFCCMWIVNTDFMRRHPVATKRALRALLRATDICHRDPKLALERLIAHGVSRNCAQMILNDARYGLWREYDPEDTVRFYALRLHELGMIKKTPNEVIAQFTDWRFLAEIKRELKT